MKITGTDEVSLNILKEIEKGIKIKDIPATYPVSLDQAKRLSRYFQLKKVSEENLSSVLQSKLELLGMKSLFLSPLFKEKDWEGLNEVLQSIDESTRRDEIPELIQALNEKRARIKEFQQQVNASIESLERQEQKIAKKEQELLALKMKVNESVKQLNKYDDGTKAFLLEHIGLLNDRYCLIKRVDSLWHKTLKKNGLVQYRETDYVYYIPNLDKFVEEYHRRIKRGGVLWDWDKEEKRYEDSYYGLPSEYYRNGNSLVSGNLKDELKAVKRQIDDIKKEREKNTEEIKELKKSSVKTFIEAIERTNTLSPRELKLHGELQDKSAKWLYSNGYVVATEITLPNGRRADVIGFNEKQHIVIIEAKASKSDFIGDKKWADYLQFCDEFFFCFELSKSLFAWNDSNRDYWNYEDRSNAGCLVVDKKKIIKHADSILEHKAKNKDKIIFLIMRSLSKRTIFGY